MKKGITMRDMAKRLNMSVSTISKALNNDPSISDLTRERVHALAKEWHYVLNESARHFKMNKSFSIGLILPDLSDQFYVMAINGIEEIAKKEKYNIFITQTHEKTIDEENIVNSMIRNRVDGLIISITKNTVDIGYLNKLKLVGIPIVCMVRFPHENPFGYVSLNNIDGAFKATDFLIKRGHTRVAHLMGPKKLHISQVRFEGYKKALKKNNLPFDPQLVKSIDFSISQTELAMQQLLNLKHPPTGIFAFKNSISLDAIEYLKRRHNHKLNRIEFTDFGNLPLFRYLDHKPIASVKEDFYKVGKQSAELLFKMIKQEESASEGEAKKIEIPCKLILNVQ